MVGRDMLGEWSDELGQAWADAQTLLFAAGRPLTEDERQRLAAALAAIKRVRVAMDAAARIAP